MLGIISSSAFRSQVPCTHTLDDLVMYHYQWFSYSIGTKVRRYLSILYCRPITKIIIQHHLGNHLQRPNPRETLVHCSTVNGGRQGIKKNGKLGSISCRKDICGCGTQICNKSTHLKQCQMFSSIPQLQVKASEVTTVWGVVSAAAWEHKPLKTNSQVSAEEERCRNILKWYQLGQVTKTREGSEQKIVQKLLGSWYSKPSVNNG